MIKFDHNFLKLHGQKEAKLRHLEIRDFSSLTEEFKDYDTAYMDFDKKGSPVRKNYPLPKKGECIKLYFEGDKGIPFSTVRQYNDNKWNFWMQRLHMSVPIVIGGKNAE